MPFLRLGRQQVLHLIVAVTVTYRHLGHQKHPFHYCARYGTKIHFGHSTNVLTCFVIEPGNHLSILNTAIQKHAHKTL